ncbi:MAG: hypothetical protein HRF49_07600 [bacterium]|jgi:hypothetical protein
MAADEALLELAYRPDGMLPKRLVLIVGPEADVTEKIFRYLWRWIVDEQVFGCAPVAKSERERYIELPWDARLEGRTTEDPRSLLGDAPVLTISDEHAQNKNGQILLAQYLLPPLTDTLGTLMLLTTPQGAANHFHDTHNDWANEARTDPRYFTSHMTSYANPFLPQGEIDELERLYRRMGMYEVFRQEYLAEFTALSGAVYPNFMPERDGQPWHVQDFDLLDGIPVSLGIDWGFRNPFVCLFAQVTGDDCVFIFDELYLTGHTLPECAEAVIERGELYGVPFAMGYPDPASPEGAHVFREYGIAMWQAPKGTKLNDVNDGILRVRGLFGRDDKPAIVIHPRCERLIRDLQNYIFNERAEGEKPVKQNDHGPDALRYLVAGAISQGLKEILWA